ncbi:MAG: hypothetical protein KDD38_00610 [Bdellovibrionales bacterium]|nr:hypothetical protein [Bdellovibrionales bacterium]
MKISTLFGVLLLICASTQAQAYSNKTVYKIPLWSAQSFESAEAKCHSLDLKLRDQIDSVENALGAEVGTVRLSTKVLVRGQSSMAKLMDSKFSCGFEFNDQSGQLRISKKMKHNYWLKQDEIQNASFCEKELSQVKGDPMNIGAYRDLGASLLQGDFCTVYFVKIELRR